jgi:hypothetical protein
MDNLLCLNKGKMMKKSLLGSLLVCSTLLLAENLAITSAPLSTSLTIYGSGIAMIDERRTAQIDHPGRVKLMYPGVPSLIDTSSVIANFLQPASLFSQNYSYDVISYDSLLKYHLGKSVLYTEDENSLERKEGSLLSVSPILIQEKNRGSIYTPYRVFFPSIPKAMAIKPSLFWNIETKSKKLDIDLKYLTRGVSWKSDYTADLVDDSLLNLNSWITITNNSGTTYQDTNITVIAGDVNMPQEQKRHPLYAKRELAPSPIVDANIQNEALLGYHIYKIPFKETIKDKGKKQISFIQKKGISYKKYAQSSENFHFYNFGEKKLQFDQVIEFKNSQDNHLGIPLPKGTVRVYKNDQSHTSRFVGASNIKDIPKDEIVKLTIGKYFDIVGKERVTAFRQTKTQSHISYDLTITNHSKKTETIKLKKSLPANLGKLTVKDSCSNECSKEHLNAFTTQYSISLKPDGVYKMAISYDMKKF